jgi:putative transposase
MVPPKVSISDLMDRVMGQISFKWLMPFRLLRKKPYWGNHFWSKGYCVDTVGLDEEIIQKYLQYQEEKDFYRESLTQGIKYNSNEAQLRPSPFAGVADDPLRAENKAEFFGTQIFTF